MIGAGGCAREVAWTLRETPPFELAGFVISDASKRTPNDAEPLFDYDTLRDFDGFVLGVGAPALRARLYDEARERFPNALWPAIVHPSVLGDRASNAIGEGAVVCAGAILTVNVTLAPHVLVHYGSIISHESSVGRFSNLNPGCRIAGAVTIEDEVSVGLGAQIIQKIRVGARAVIGAGAVVIRDVAPGVTVAGVPARVLRVP